MNHSHMTLQEIGRIHSPHKDQAGTPIQSGLGESTISEAHIHPEFREGLSDLDGFSRIWLICWLDRSKPYKLKVIPYRDTVERGLFATRAPSRPNPIGISSVELLSVDITTGILRMMNIDFLNGTPILDIKPYASKFDTFTDIRNGWLDKGLSTRTADNRFNNNE